MLLTPEEWEVVRLSLRVALVAVVGTFPLGLLLAYGLARRRVPVPFVVENLVQLPLVLPPVVTGLLLLLALGPNTQAGRSLEAVFGGHLAFSWLGASLAAGVVAFPLMVQTMRVAIEQIDPTLEEAIYMEGGGTWQAFRFVTFPLALRGIAAGVVLAFARAVGEFGATIVLAGNIPGRTRTIPLAIFTRINQVGGEAAALRLVLIAVFVSVASLVLSSILTRRAHRAEG